jgi:hypothetical protein
MQRPPGFVLIRLAPVLMLGVAGCAVTAVDGTRMGLKSDDFAAYVETVFRRQNEMASELALAIEAEDPDSERYAALDAVELALLDACLGINELAARQRDGEPLRGLKALARAKAAPACERATTAAKNILVSDT